MESAESPGSAPARSANPLLGKLRDVALLFVPTPIREALKQGLGLTLLIIASTFLVLPLLIVFFAALSLNLLGKLENNAANALRQEYLQFIHSGFSIDEVARKTASGQNVRLDYFQILEFDLAPNERRDHRVSLERGQRALLEVNTVKLIPTKDKCPSLPEEKGKTRAALLVVSLGPVRLREFGEFETFEGDKPKTFEIDDGFWKKNWEKFEDSEMPLRFAAVQPCGKVGFAGSVKVYKDMLDNVKAGLKP